MKIQSFKENAENKGNLPSSDSINYLLTGESKIIGKT